MADSTSAVAASPVSAADLARAEKFTFEPFIHEGDDPAVVLAEGTPRRRALDEALAELDKDLDQPSIAWRQKYSLMLGLERLLAQDEPKLADGTVLNAHQVDALSGTMVALMAELQSASRNGSGPDAAVAEPLPEEEEDEDWDGDEEDDEDEEDEEDEQDQRPPGLEIGANGAGQTPDLMDLLNQPPEPPRRAGRKRSEGSRTKASKS